MVCSHCGSGGAKAPKMRCHCKLQEQLRPSAPYRLCSPIWVAPTVITPDLAHSEVTEIGADVVFVSGCGEGGSGGKMHPSPTTNTFPNTIYLCWKEEKHFQ